MTDIADVLGQLRTLGYHLAAVQPDRIRFQFLETGPPPEEAIALLDHLRQHKPEALRLLTCPGAIPRWDETTARTALAAAIAHCDRIARATGSWSSAWTWCRGARQDLAAALDYALDALDAAHLLKDGLGHGDACTRLVEAVLAVAKAYGDRP